MKYEVYLMYCNDMDAYKIGISKNSEKRRKQLNTGCPYKIEIRSVYKTYRPFKIEGALHTLFLKYKRNYDTELLFGEWFDGEYSIREIHLLKNLLGFRDSGEICFDLWTSRMLDELAKEVGLFSRTY